MSVSRFADHLQTGVHGSRPAANAVATGALYSCTTHSLIYVSDGSATWSTWASLSGTVVVLGQPTGTLSRTYTFATTTESWTASGAGVLTSSSARLHFDGSAGISFALEPSGAGNVANGEVQMEYRGISGTSMGVIFRAADASNFYLVILNPSGTITFYKYVAGVQTSLGAGPTSLLREGTGLTYTILVRFNGAKVELFINEAWIFSWVDTTYTTGIVGVSQNTGVVEIDNVKVYSLP